MMLTYNQLVVKCQAETFVKAKLTENMYRMAAGMEIWFGLEGISRLSTFNNNTDGRNRGLYGGIDLAYEESWKENYTGKFEVVDEVEPTPPIPMEFDQIVGSIGWAYKVAEEYGSVNYNQWCYSIIDGTLTCTDDDEVIRVTSFSIMGWSKTPEVKSLKEQFVEDYEECGDIEEVLKKYGVVKND